MRADYERLRPLLALDKGDTRTFALEEHTAYLEELRAALAS